MRVGKKSDKSDSQLCNFVNDLFRTEYATILHSMMVKFFFFQNDATTNTSGVSNIFEIYEDTLDFYSSQYLWTALNDYFAQV